MMMNFHFWVSNEAMSHFRTTVFTWLYTCIEVSIEVYMARFQMRACLNARESMLVGGRVNGWERWRLRQSFENKESEVSPHTHFSFSLEHRALSTIMGSRGNILNIMVLFAGAFHLLNRICGGNQLNSALAMLNVMCRFLQINTFE